MEEVVIVAAGRSPIGSFGGVLSTVPATQIASQVIKAMLERGKLSPDLIDEVYMGMVLPAGVGQSPARQASIFAGIPSSVPTTTLNKVCGSGMKTIMLGAAQIALGEADFILAGGMENMSLVPHALPGSRNGYKMGDVQAKDLMVLDGLWDVYNNYHMGVAAEQTAKEYGITREMQDEFAIASYKKAIQAIEKGSFRDEIIPIAVPQRKGEPKMVEQDEEPGRVMFDKIPGLRPAFQKDGTVTAANASSINDGAAAVLLASKSRAQELGLPILATLKGWSSFAREPEWFTTAPAAAIEKLLKKMNRKPEDIDLYEVNEAFSVVSLVVNKLANLPTDRVNIHGGAVALGHPLGCSGTRIVVTLLNAMEKQGSKTGLASLCIGGGEATAIMVEK